MPLGAGFQNVNFTDACRIRGSPAVREPSRTDWKRRAACWSGDLFGGIGGGKQEAAGIAAFTLKTAVATAMAAVFRDFRYRSLAVKAQYNHILAEP